MKRCVWFCSICASTAVPSYATPCSQNGCAQGCYYALRPVIIRLIQGSIYQSVQENEVLKKRHPRLGAQADLAWNLVSTHTAIHFWLSNLCTCELKIRVFWKVKNCIPSSFVIYFILNNVKFASLGTATWDDLKKRAQQMRWEIQRRGLDLTSSRRPSHFVEALSDTCNIAATNF